MRVVSKVDKINDRAFRSNEKEKLKTLRLRVWGALFISVILVFSVLLLKLEAQYYDIHKENQIVTAEINGSKEILSELEVIENELSSPKRILKIAKEQGLEYHEENLITVD
jgi:cell division protein FtsL